MRTATRLNNFEHNTPEFAFLSSVPYKSQPIQVRGYQPDLRGETPMRLRLVFAGLLSLSTIVTTTLVAQSRTPTTKPLITLDEFFNFVSYSDIKLSPDGNALLIGTERADWKREKYRKDIWLWRTGSSAPLLLTQSGKDSHPQWSPDGKWIAFISDRVPESPLPEDEDDVPKEPKPKPLPPNPPKGRDADDEKPDADKAVPHLYLLSVEGGEAFPVTKGLEEIHAYAWSPDSHSLYFATRTPWNKAKRDAYKKEWKDVVRYRESERGDVIARLSIADAIARRAEANRPESKPTPKNVETAETPGSVLVTPVKHRVNDLQVSPDGRTLAFTTDSVSQRVEGVDAYEIYISPTEVGGTPRQLTNNQAIEDTLRWTPNGKSLLFAVHSGSVEGKYEDVQNRVYSVDIDNGAVHRWASEFPGALADWAITFDGALLTAARVGTEVQLYSSRNAQSALKQYTGWPGTYEWIATATRSPKIAFVYCSLDRPTEVYIADSADALQSAKPVTAFNKLFTERALPQGRPYKWKADDGSDVEGMLIFPPGKLGAKNLRMLTLIHGGPADADGNKFGADWYDWAILAATNNWLVLRPNYRGSSGYGDKFMREIVPQIVTRPGKDILEGVDALIKDGIANPDQLTIGGYSYGGYMTNWLITQTTRFKSAVTGAGAVEHAANWGNDDLTFDDAYYLGGEPWKVPANYTAEAALFQFDKVKTATHVVGGADDVRVAAAENYLLERALTAINVPNSLLVFPGEGHSLSKNPWHGKIKVREELKWLERFSPHNSLTSPSAHQ
jgi:dipeptidyl aminopeptidase/acylaminoacyl peptidase